MIDNINTEHILFLDIETVPMYPDYSYLPDRWKKLWERKAEQKRKDQTPAEFYTSAGIFAEFGKIVCICVGYFQVADGKRRFRIKSFAGDLEKELLTNFAELLNKHFSQREHSLCAHNGKEFDFPFIARRMLVNGVKLPSLLDIAGKKPWEVQLLDTMELWRFGDYKSYTSVELLAALFGIPTPKDDIDGSRIYSVYWEEKNLERIVKYCRKDVLTIAQIYLRMKGEPTVPDADVVML